MGCRTVGSPDGASGGVGSVLSRPGDRGVGDVRCDSLRRRREPHKQTGRDERHHDQRRVLDRRLCPFHARDATDLGVATLSQVVTIASRSCLIAYRPSPPAEPSAVSASAEITGSRAAGTSIRTTTSSIRGAAIAARS